MSTWKAPGHVETMRYATLQVAAGRSSSGTRNRLALRSAAGVSVLRATTCASVVWKSIPYVLRIDASPLVVAVEEAVAVAQRLELPGPDRPLQLAELAAGHLR